MLTRQVDVLIQMPNAEIPFANAFRVLLISMEHAKRVSLFTVSGSVSNNCQY